MSRLRALGAALREALRAEWLGLLRTREIYTYLLLPAVLGVPLLAAGMTLARTVIDTPDRVAFPADTPVELDLAAELEAGRIIGVPSEDPRAAWANGDVDAAIVDWRRGDGVGDTLDDGVSGLVRWRWRARLLGGDEALRDALSDAVEDAGDAALEGWVIAAGGDVDADLWVANTLSLPVEQVDLAGRAGRFIPAYLAFALGLVSVFTVVGFTAADRDEGVTETQISTASAPWTWLLARVLCVTALQAMAALALVASLSVLMTALGARLPMVSWFAPRLLVALCATNAVMLLVGVLAPGVRVALGAGSYLLMGLGVLLGWGVFGAPVAVPFAGLLAAQSLGELAMASGLTLGLAAICVILASRSLGPATRRTT